MAISYEKIWDSVIWKNISSLSNIDGIKFFENSKIKQDIKDNFEFFSNYCKKNYMNPESVKNLDRHKIAACFMYAIIKTDMFKSYPKSSSNNNIIIINEQIAISVGLSILRTYIVNKCDPSGKEKEKTVWEQDKKIFESGFKLPGEDGANDVSHGEYRNNFAMILYFTKKENTYNILSLSNTLYLLEMYNRHLYEIQHNQSPL